MTDELFDIPETLSPKESWKRQHSITTRIDDRGAWIASIGQMEEKGDEENQALFRLASRVGIPLWITIPNTDKQ